MIVNLFFGFWFEIGIAIVLGSFLFRKVRVLIQLRHIKGPLLHRITGIPHTLAILGGTCHSWYNKLNQKYGQLVVAAPTVLLTSSPALWAHINTHPGYTKSQWYYLNSRFDWRHDNVFTQRDNEKHHERRKQMIRGYSGAENLTLDADIKACVVKLLHLTRSRYAGQGKAMDLAQKIQFYTLDVISTIGFGKCYNLLNADEDPNEYLKSTHDGLWRANIQIAFNLWWVNWIPFVAPQRSLDVETTKGFYKMTALNATMVEAREKEFHEQKKSGVVPRADMLTCFMKNGLLGNELKTENILQVVAGSDTTASSLRGIMLYLITNSRVYKKLQAEIDEAVGSGMAPPAPEIIQPTQAKELIYLQAVIKEALRVYSPVNNPFARDTPPEGDTVIIDGEEIYLPGGVSIIPSFKAMHRNRSVYGEDADVEVFRPERWLEEKDEKKMEAMKQEHSLMFGHGPWLCLGKGIALRQLGVVIFELLRNFDWTLVNPETPWEDANYMGLHSTTDMWVLVEERKKS
ncbi:cytochrome P450 [Xylaria cf. heliscus]|nr:cytochrome P450 [Xylaria cf. heliscus]